MHIPPSASADPWKAYLAGVAAGGAADATLHNNTFGAFGGDHSDQYNSDDENAAYYQGRLGGDVSSLFTSTSEIEGGAGGLMHGAAAAGLATGDIQSVVQKLFALSNSHNGSNSGGSPSNPTKFQTSPANSPDAEKIGDGHAWGKHRGEFPEINTQDEFKKLIDKVKSSGTSLYKKLLRNREAWYDSASNTLVIKDPNAKDGGTMFRPKDKSIYFNNLK